MRQRANSTTNPDYRDLTQTPKWLFRAMNKSFHFGLDVAAIPLSALCPAFITPEMDALADTTDWWSLCRENEGGERNAWCNPPYSDIAPWVTKAWDQSKKGLTTVMLLPADATGKWWPDCTKMRFDVINITGGYDEKGRWRSGRIAFVDAETGKNMGGNMVGSLFLIFGPRVQGARHYISKLRLMQVGGV